MVKALRARYHRDLMRVPSDTRRLSEVPDVRRESTERRILESTTAILDSGTPWSQVGIRQIAERAAISRTAFYDFFAGKNEVIEQLISGLVEELRSLLVEAARQDGRDPDEPLVVDLAQSDAIIAVAAEFFARYGAVYQAFLDGMGDDPRLNELWDDLVDVFAELFGNSLDAARAADPELPTALPSRDVAITCLLMVERSFMVQRRASRGGPESLTALVPVISAACQMAVFGRLAAPATAS